MQQNVYMSYKATSIRLGDASPCHLDKVFNKIRVHVFIFSKLLFMSFSSFSKGKPIKPLHKITANCKEENQYIREKSL